MTSKATNYIKWFSGIAFIAFRDKGEELIKVEGKGFCLRFIFFLKQRGLNISRTSFDMINLSVTIKVTSVIFDGWRGLSYLLSAGQDL